jgi:hypothetical protein
VVADRREPAYDGKSHLSAAELDPSKIYRVAMGYYGLPSYGAEPARMPKLFPFATAGRFSGRQVGPHSVEELPSIAASRSPRPRRNTFSGTKKFRRAVSVST